MRRSDSPVEIRRLEESKIGPRFDRPLPSTARAPDMLPNQNRTRVNVQGVSESSGELSSPSSSFPRLHSIELPTSLPVDGLCSEAVDSCFSIPSFVPGRLSEGVAPVIQGGSTVLARRFAMRVWLPLRGLPSSPRLHIERKSVVPSSGGVCDCRCSSIMIHVSNHNAKGTLIRPIDPSANNPGVAVRSALSCVGRRTA